MNARKRTSRRLASRRRHRRVHGGQLVRRIVRNTVVGGIDVIEKIAFPALGATGGLLAAQWLGTKVGPSWFPGSDPRLMAAGGSLLSAFGAYMLGGSLGLSPETQLTVAAGAGVAGILPWVPPAMLSAPIAPTPPVATSGYYQRSMLSGLMVDVSHAGSPYKGMLGLGDDADTQGAVDDVMNVAEAVSTVEPIDLALPAKTKNAVRRVREQMGTPGDRGWAGGVFGRNIFSAV